MSNSRCPTCDGPCWGPYYPESERKPGGNAGPPVYAGYGGRRAFEAVLTGVSDRPYNYGPEPGLYAWSIESDGYRDQPVPVLPFFSPDRSIRIVPAELVAQVLTALDALVKAVREAAYSGEPCPTCSGPSFVRDGARYALRGTAAVEAAARALYAVPSGTTYQGQSMPFFSERFLYAAVGKDDGRSVLSRPHVLLRCAGIEDVWRLEDA